MHSVKQYFYKYRLTDFVKAWRDRDIWGNRAKLYLGEGKPLTTPHMNDSSTCVHMYVHMYIYIHPVLRIPGLTPKMSGATPSLIIIHVSALSFLFLN